MIRAKEFLALVKKAQQALKSGVSRKAFEFDHRKDIIGKALAGKAYDAARAIQLATDPGAYRAQLRPGKVVKDVVTSPTSREGQCHVLKAGLGATLYVGSDRYPYTLVGWTANGEIIYLTADKYTRTDKNGFSESQTYTCETNPEAPPEKAVWSRTQKRYRIGGTGIYLGERKAYLDPGF
jgi:hypothetical protein